MDSSLLKYIAPITQWWNKFNPRQKRNLVISLVSALICVVVIVWFTTRPNYVTVMSGLDDNSLGQVQQQLNTLKIPNKINGTSILVPKADADEARIQLSMAGLPKTGAIDYSSVKSSYAMTQAQFNLQVLNVLQQQLAQTIDQMNGVVASQVNIVIPQQSNMFVNNNQPSKASVFLQVGTGAQVSPSEVAGIQSLVAHSVSGLSAGNVSVVDQNGTTLSSQGATSSTGAVLTNSELSLRQQIESQLQQQLQGGLSQIVGPGNVVVTVNADVSFNRVVSQSHSVTPAQGQSTGLPTSQQITKSSSSSTGGAPSGAATTSSSNPGSAVYLGSAGSASNSTSTQSSSTTNYDNNYVNTQTTNDPIQINGYSVGVLVDSTNKAITPQVLSQIKSYVQNTVGSMPGQKNSVTVSTVPFQHTGTTLLSPAKNSILPFAIGGAALLLFGGGATWLIVSRRKRQRGMAPEQEPVLYTEDLAQPNEADHMKRRVAKLANDKPEEFAKMLRTWLNED